MSAAVFTWAPYHDAQHIGQGGLTFLQTDIDGAGLDISVTLHGASWVQYQAGGQLSIAPISHGDLAFVTIELSHSAVVSIDFSALMYGQFRHGVGNFAFSRGQIDIEARYSNLYGVTESGGWLSNSQLWSHDGRFTVTSSDAADRLTFAVTTLPGASSAAPYWSTIRIPQITLTPANVPGAQIPEPSSAVLFVALMIAAGLSLRRKGGAHDRNL